MLLIEGTDDRIVAEGDLDVVGAVAVVNDPFGHVPWSDVVVGTHPLDTPPAGGHTDLVGVAFGTIPHIEGSGLHLLPNILRNRVDLLSGGIALRGEAIGTVPVDCTVPVGIVVLPDDCLLGLPMSTVLGRLVSQLRQKELPSVKSIHLAHEGSVIDSCPRDVENNRVRTLAVESLILDDNGIAVLVQQFNPADELQVVAIDGELFSALDGLAFLLGIAGNDRFAKRKVQTGLHFTVGRTDDDLAAFGSYAGRGGNPDHLTADNLEISDGDAIGEDYFTDIRKPGAVDGHRLPRDHLGRGEHFDAKSEIGRFYFFRQVARRKGTHQGNRKKYSEILKYLLHNCNPYCLEHYQPGFWVRFGFLFSSVCGIG